jgi:hypothetical protein
MENVGILLQEKLLFVSMHKIQLSLTCDVKKPVKSQTYTLLYLTELQNNSALLVSMDTDTRNIKLARNL